MKLEEKLSHYRISDSEYEKIKEVLGREPEGVEWALFSALWSEHCSYKSSRLHLKKFFSDSDRVLESFGENAGVIDLGDGERVAFKMESHNHPSFISPVQGAATGVGGILRDIFTMGARPVALANYLCFGDPKTPRMTGLVDGVVDGISFYGNCVGVPMLTGQTEFNESYNGNILVNALALGLFRPGESVFTSKSAEPGQLVVYVGAKTGRDGVHGASMASESFDEDGDESKKPTVQIGDPFFEKLLIESCLEVMSLNLVESIQDMGAAGLTSSAFEMASKAGVGFVMHLDRVPMRDQGMTPEEILLSESQERMLLTCRQDQLEQLQQVFKKWDLDAEVIGEVQKGKSVSLYWYGELICDQDPDVFVENAPLYDRPHRKWEPLNRVDSSESIKWNQAGEYSQRLKAALTDVRGGSRQWVYRQYDQRVGAKTHRDCSHTIGVVRLPDSGRGLGLVLGCRPYVMRFDCAQGGKDSVAYPSLQLACKGFEPLALTDCLNFGNPEKPELMTEFVAAVEAMSAQCEKLDVPVISGNVSLYNETNDKNVTSTPSTGVVGLRSNLENIPKDLWVKPGSQIFLIKNNQLITNGQMAELEGCPPQGLGNIDESEVATFAEGIRGLGLRPEVLSSRVVGKFGLAGTAAKMSLNGLGAKISLAQRIQEMGSADNALFGECFYEVLFEVEISQADAFEQLAKETFAVEEVERLGQVQTEKLEMENYISMTTEELMNCYNGSWKENFETLA